MVLSSRSSRAVKLSSFISENSAFGTVTIVRSRERMRVEIQPICSTVPISSP